MRKFEAASAVMKPKALFAADMATRTFTGNPIDVLDDGTSMVRNVEIFKAGTFKDSWGDQATWTPEHLTMMVANYNLLRGGGQFVDVPVRRDHSMSIDKVMGYFDSMWTDGLMLFADLHITESSQMSKLTRGTYRSRSLEIGMFETNAGAMYWPVVFGVAYVDIPAVEGLHSKDIKVSYFSQTSEPKETAPVSTETAPPTTPPAAPAPAATAPPAAAPPAAPPAATAKFRVNGADVEDISAVQRHIDALELFARDTQAANRAAFVKSLVTAGKITAPLEAGLAAMAATLNEAQYAEFTKAYEAAPVLSILSKHGGNQTEGSPPEEDAAADHIEVLKETIAMHRRAGMTEERIAKSKAFVELTALTTNKN